MELNFSAVGSNPAMLPYAFSASALVTPCLARISAPKVDPVAVRLISSALNP